MRTRERKSSDILSYHAVLPELLLIIDHNVCVVLAPSVTALLSNLAYHVPLYSPLHVVVVQLKSGHRDPSEVKKSLAIFYIWLSLNPL
jgi:hypothetical protein